MKNGEAPQHLVSWAPNDWLTSRVRARSALQQDWMLRTVYFELLNVLYANGGDVPADPSCLSDLLLLPADEIERRLPVLVEIGSITVADGVVRQPRVTKELRRYDELTMKRREAARIRWDTDASAKHVNASAEQVQSNAMHGAMAKATATAKDANEVLTYWKETTGCKVRSSAVEAQYLKRIAARLRDGLTVEELKRCVDVAKRDPFYVEQGYFRQPDVIWRNAERVQSLLSKVDHARSRPLPL